MMTLLRGFLGAAIAVWAAAPAHASSFLIEVSINPAAGAPPSFAWTPSASGHGGAFSNLVQDFTISDLTIGSVSFSNIPVELTLSASDPTTSFASSLPSGSGGRPATLFFENGVFTGSVSLRYAGAGMTEQGITFAPGENILTLPLKGAPPILDANASLAGANTATGSFAGFGLEGQYDHGAFQPTSDLVSFPDVSFSSFGLRGVTNTPLSFTPGQSLDAFEITLNSQVGFAVATIPEPETWAMLILGFGMIGAARRLTVRRKGVRG